MPNNSKLYNVLIVGAGNIGALYDSPACKNILTHAHAFSIERRFNLLGFVDTDLNKAKKAALIWSCDFFVSIADAFSKYDIDVVCVAVPDDFHYEILKNLVNFPIKFVFAEKPLTKTLQEGQEIVALYKKHNIALQVNYSRRFVPEFLQLKSLINSGKFGKYISGTGYYGKGILHNGSHLINLIRFLIGEIKSVKVVSRENDFYQDDPSVSAVLKFCFGGDFFLQKINCFLYTLFEIDLLFEKKRIRIVDHGFYIEEYDVGKDIHCDGYEGLLKNKKKKTSYGKALFYATKNIGDYLDGKDGLRCCGKEALKDMEICLLLKNKTFEYEKNFIIRQGSWRS